MKNSKIIVPVLILVVGGGFFAWKSFSKKPTVNTQDWKTYQNNTYHFKVSYPPQYTLENTQQDRVTFRDTHVTRAPNSDDPGKFFIIKFSSVKDEAGIIQWFCAENAGSCDFKTTKNNVATIDGTKAMEYDFAPGDIIYYHGYLITHNGTVAIEAAKNGTGSEEVVRDLPDIVSTFSSTN